MYVAIPLYRNTRISVVDTVWFATIVLFAPLAITTLFALAPILTSFCIAAAAATAVYRSLVNEVWATIVAMAFGVVALTVALVVVDHRRAFDRYHRESTLPFHPMAIAPWTNVGYVSDSIDSVTLRLRTTPHVRAPSDVLLRTAFYERRNSANELRCDPRCILLLRSPGVASVTISPEPDIWREGPRAVMPGFVPDARTFTLSNTRTCQAIWKAPLADYSNEPRGTAISDLHQALEREESCIQSGPVSPTQIIDGVVEEKIDVQKWQPYPLPPGAVI